MFGSAGLGRVGMSCVGVAGVFVLLLGMWFSSGDSASAATSRAPTDVNGDGFSDLCQIWGLNGGATGTGKIELHCANGATNYQTTVLATGTIFPYWSTHYQVPLLADVNADGVSDLCVLTGVNGGTSISGLLQIQCANGATGYSTELFNEKTKFAKIITQHSLPFLADVNADGRADLCLLTGVNGGTTTSGSLEVHCANAATNYTTAALDRATGYPRIDTRYTAPLMADLDADGKADLCLLTGMNGATTSSGGLEVRCASGASFYLSSIVNRSLSGCGSCGPYPYLDTRSDVPLFLDLNGDGRADLCDVSRNNNQSSDPVLGCWDGASLFQNGELHSGFTEFTRWRTDQRKFAHNGFEQPAAPLALASGPSNSVPPNTPFTLSDAGSYDPNENSSLQYFWQQVSGPPLAIEDDRMASTTVEGFTASGQLATFSLTVTNNYGVSSTTLLTVRSPK